MLGGGLLGAAGPDAKLGRERAARARAFRASAEESPRSKGPRGPRAALGSVIHLRSTWRLIAAKYIPTLCADSSASPPHGDDKDDDEEATPEEETMPEA